jgi:transposase
VIYVGMDISSKDFMIYAIDERKKEKFKGAIAPTRKSLRDLVAALGAEKKVFIFESGNQMKWIADFFKSQGEEIHVVHPNEVKWITQSGGKKTDKVDAKKLAELGRADMLPRRVHVAEGSARDLRELVGARQTVLNKRVALMNTIRSYLKQEGIRLPAKFFTSNDWQVTLIGLKLRQATEIIVANLMFAIEQMQECEKGLNAEIQKITNKKIELIETIPGIGKLSSRILFAALVTAERFDNSKCVANYGALTPTIHQSGDTKHLGKINRDGRGEVRRAMLQCAHAVARTKTAGVKPLKDFFERIEKRRGKKRAIVALARKLLTTVYGVLKSGEVYNPAKLKAA